jgi:ketosteroid isomerase-like protein
VKDRALLDRIALTDLVMRYCRGIDRRDFALVRSLYHDDAIDDHGAMFCGGPDDFVRRLPDMMAQWEATIHSISNSLFAIDGDTAEGEHQVTAFHRTYPPERKEFTVWGRYLDTYQRRDGVWKFSHRSLVFDHGRITPVDEDSFVLMGSDAVHGRANRFDPSWQMPLLAGLGR